MPQPDLEEAVREGNLDAIRSLLDGGADVRYVRPDGYTVMIDAMFGANDEQLVPIMKLLIDQGADLDAVSAYGESALSVASNIGRFDVVGVLLAAGADSAPLEWTTLLQLVVALGSVADVQLRIEACDDLSARDRWDRTAWLLSLQTGEMDKAEALYAAGAKIADRGRCGRTSLMYAIHHQDEAMLRWLLALGADPNAMDDFGGTALIEAAGIGATDCLRILLEAGADRQ